MKKRFTEEQIIGLGRNYHKKARFPAGFVDRPMRDQAMACDRENGVVSLIICTKAFGLPARISPWSR